MFAAIRRYTITRGSADSLTRAIEDQFVPVITGITGFVSYDVLTERPDALVTVSVFETEDGIRASSERAAEFVREHLPEHGLTRTEVIQGAVTVHRHGALAGAH
jgi:heme-degrading monooxygenase HmoA